MATRFVILPVIGLALLSSLRLERLLKRAGRSLRVWVISIAALATMALGFLEHSFLWSVGRLERITELKAEPPVPGLIVRDDPGYKLVVVLSLAVTIAGLAAVAYMLLRARLARGRISRNQGSTSTPA